MTTIEEAKKKWTEATKIAGEKWKRGVEGKEEAYCKGVADFLGVPSCAPDKRDLYKLGVERVSAESFQKSVENKSDKWAENLRKALGAPEKKPIAREKK